MACYRQQDGQLQNDRYLLMLRLYVSPTSKFSILLALFNIPRLKYKDTCVGAYCVSRPKGKNFTLNLNMRHLCPL
jgi:hypothetical protein